MPAITRSVVAPWAIPSCPDSLAGSEWVLSRYLLNKRAVRGPVRSTGSCPGPCLVAEKGESPPGLSFHSLHLSTRGFSWMVCQSLFWIAGDCEMPASCSLTYVTSHLLLVGSGGWKRTVSKSSTTFITILLPVPTFKVSTNVISLEPPEHSPRRLFCRAWTNRATGLQPQHQFSSVQSLSCVRLFATPWIAARQASLSITNSQSSLRLTSIESVMPSSHLILCRPFLLRSPIPPSIRVFSNESALRMRWPKYWSFSFSISPSNEYSGLISFRMDWLDLLAVQGTLKSLLQHHSSKASILKHSAFFTVESWLLQS